MNMQKSLILSLVVGVFASSLYVDVARAQSRKGCGDITKKCCGRLPQPPILPAPYGEIIQGENCLCCFENRQLPFKTDLNDNKICQSYDELCASLCGPLNFPTDISSPRIIPNPAFVVPPCQKDIFPPVVPNPLNIRGKNVLIIGGSKGMGKAIAERFASEEVGCNVIATSRHPECYEKPLNYSLKKVDVRLEEDVESFINHVVEKCFNGRIDILVNCAAVFWAGPLAQATGDDLLNILNNDIVGYHRVTHYALPHMRHNNETRVISFGSLAGYFVAPGLGGYGISKLANQKWNDTMQIEEMFAKKQGFEKFGPTFTCMEPGFILTSIGLYEWYQASGLSPEDPRVQGLHQALATSQNTGDALAPAASAEAVFRVAVAPQPGVRYAVTDETTLQALKLSNTLSQDDAINLVWAPFVTEIFKAFPQDRPILSGTYCGCIPEDGASK